jgi:peroxiredoxin
MQRLLALAWLAASLAFSQEYKLGSKIADFTVDDLNGSPVQFSALRGPVTVVVFTSTNCPVSNAYNGRMNAVYRDYSAKGVKFIFVNANQNESAADVASHAKSVGFVFPVYKDPNNVLADRFDAQVTPETYVIDSTGTLVYHGQIDDSRNEQRVQQQGLRMALDAVLAGKPVGVAETKAFGCSIKRVRRTT